METQALISLSEAVQGQITDRPATDRDRRSYPPLYQEAADLLADDVLRLLTTGTSSRARCSSTT